MKHWNLNSYKRPYLAIDEIFLNSEQGVTIQKSGVSYEIAQAASSISSNALLDAFHSLRDPDGELWSSIKSSSEIPKALVDILRRIDEFGLLAESDDGGVKAYSYEKECAEQLITSMVKWLNTGRESVSHGELVNNVRRVLHEGLSLLHQYAGECLSEQHSLETGLVELTNVGTLSQESNFYLRTIFYQQRYWKQGSPLTLAYAVLALSEFEAGLVGESQRIIRPQMIEWIRNIADHLVGGVYDIKDLKENLNSLSAILLLSASSSSQRTAFVPLSVRAPKSGINLMLEAEQTVLQILNQLGTTKYFDALSTGTATTNLAKGTYIEQYHITRRFVEVITPMLAKRLRRDLREQMFDYYEDEVGHEIFELNACRALGVDETQVRTSLPLPLSVAYIDAYTYISQIDPIGFLLCFIVTEGLPGTRTPVNEYFKKHGLIEGEGFEEVTRQHENVNIDHNHTTLARNMLAEIPYVSVANQLAALDHLAFMLELGFRSWDMLYHYYENVNMPLHHSWLSMEADELIDDAASRSS